MSYRLDEKFKGKGGSSLVCCPTSNVTRISDLYSEFLELGVGEL